MAENTTSPGRAADCKTTNTAILVIHGIGQQNPYETLDAFAQGLARHFRQGGAVPRIHPERIDHGEWIQVALHLEFDRPTTANGLRQVSLFEFYWAPYTEGMASVRGVVSWLIRTAFTPLRYLTDNLQVLLEVKKQKDWKSIAGLFLREVSRGVFLYLPLVLVLLLLGLFLAKGAAALGPMIDGLSSAIRNEPHPFALAGTTLSLTMALVLVNFIRKEFWGWHRRPGPSIEKVAERWWLGLAAGCLVVLLAIAAALTWRKQVDVRTYVGLLVNWGTIGLLLIFTVGWFLRGVMVKYVGDVAVYVTADEKSAHYQARSTILKASTEALTRLLVSQTYDQVIVAGHSLGSVIAYDTINRVLSKAWATPGPLRTGTPPLARSDLDKLRGLVTFGSPLDKVYYFFREQVRADQSVRAQILSFLHSFRRGYSGRTYGELQFAYEAPNLPGTGASAFPELRNFRWLNVWAPMDPVSGRLDFYRLDAGDQLRRWYAVWGAAHLDYWQDPQFYKFVADRLL